MQVMLVIEGHFLLALYSSHPCELHTSNREEACITCITCTLKS